MYRDAGPPAVGPRTPRRTPGDARPVDNHLCTDGGHATEQNCPRGEEVLARPTPHGARASAGLEKASPDQKTQITETQGGK